MSTFSLPTLALRTFLHSHTPLLRLYSSHKKLQFLSPISIDDDRNNKKGSSIWIATTSPFHKFLKLQNNYYLVACWFKKNRSFSMYIMGIILLPLPERQELQRLAETHACCEPETGDDPWHVSIKHEIFHTWNLYVLDFLDECGAWSGSVQWRMISWSDDSVDPKIK